MKYTLNVKETGSKAARFHYTVTDETGTVISERKSNRQYVACTINGQYYFGRLDLIGKGDHGKQVQYCAGARWMQNSKGKMVLTPGQADPVEPTPIAYLKTELI